MAAVMTLVAPEVTAAVRSALLAHRLSLGVQSFAPAQLATLGRIHDATEAQRAIELAPRASEREQ